MWSKGQGKRKKKVRVWKAPREKHVLNCLLLLHKWKKQKPSQNCEEKYLCSSQTYYWWAMFLLSANVPTLTLSPFIPRHLATGGAPSRQQVWNSCFAKTSLVSLPLLLFTCEYALGRAWPGRVRHPHPQGMEPTMGAWLTASPELQLLPWNQHAGAWRVWRVWARSQAIREC